jgi:hypothetical protein
LAVDGELEDDELIEAFVADYPVAERNLHRWFFDSPLHDQGRTWVLSKMWGAQSEAVTHGAFRARRRPDHLRCELTRRGVSRSVYVTAMGAASGKFLVTLGLVEMLARRVKAVGFYRPVVPRSPDNDIELIKARYHCPTRASATRSPVTSTATFVAERGPVAAMERALRGTSRSSHAATSS